MYKGISAPFIHRPIATTLIMVAVLLVGLVAFPSLPVAPLPQVDFPTITVSAQLPGASPDTIATSVAQPLERQIAQIPGVSQMTSTSSLGATAITVQFDLNRNIDAAANDIQAAINAAAGQLPKDLPSPPTYRKVNPSDTPILILSVQSDVAPIIDVDDAAENILAQHLSQISGVSLVRVGGQVTPAMRIQIDPAKLVEMGLQLEDVRAADRHRHRGQSQRRDPRKQTDLHDLQQRSADDRAAVERRHHRLPKRRARPHPRHRPGGHGTDRHDAGRLVQRQAQRLSRHVQDSRRERHQHRRGDQGAHCRPLQAAIPPTIHVSVLSDRTLTIRASVHDVEFTLMLTVALVVMVIFVFLRSFWATIIPSVTVPLALLGRLRADVGGGLQPRQSVADGVHHRGRLRRR